MSPDALVAAGMLIGAAIVLITQESYAPLRRLARQARSLRTRRELA